MRHAVVLGAALSCIAAAAPRYDAMDDARRAATWETASAKGFPARLVEVSAPFLSTPYHESPLGEGAGVDPDPRLRWDEVDCVTFLETIIALANAPSWDRVGSVLDDIRYAGGEATFETRNHFVESQWIPNNIRKGYIEDVTRKVGGSRVVKIRKEYSAARWAKRKSPAALPLTAAQVPMGVFTYDAIPLEVLRERMDDVPSGTLMWVVRQDFFSQPTRVTHVGMIIGPKGARVLRHASKKPYARVVDEPLAHFLSRNAAYSKWPVEGFILTQVKDARDRARTLAAAK